MIDQSLAVIIPQGAAEERAIEILYACFDVPTDPEWEAEVRAGARTRFLLAMVDRGRPGSGAIVGPNGESGARVILLECLAAALAAAGPPQGALPTEEARRRLRQGTLPWTGFHALSRWGEAMMGTRRTLAKGWFEWALIYCILYHKPLGLPERYIEELVGKAAHHEQLPEVSDGPTNCLLTEAEVEVLTEWRNAFARSPRLRNSKRQWHPVQYPRLERYRIFFDEALKHTSGAGRSRVGVAFLEALRIGRGYTQGLERLADAFSSASFATALSGYALQYDAAVDDLRFVPENERRQFRELREEWLRRMKQPLDPTMALAGFGLGSLDLGLDDFVGGPDVTEASSELADAPVGGDHVAEGVRRIAEGVLVGGGPGQLAAGSSLLGALALAAAALAMCRPDEPMEAGPPAAQAGEGAAAEDNGVKASAESEPPPQGDNVRNTPTENGARMEDLPFLEGRFRTLVYDVGLAGDTDVVNFHKSPPVAGTPFLGSCEGYGPDKTGVVHCWLLGWEKHAGTPIHGVWGSVDDVSVSINEISRLPKPAFRISDCVDATTQYEVNLNIVNHSDQGSVLFDWVALDFLDPSHGQDRTVYPAPYDSGTSGNYLYAESGGQTTSLLPPRTTRNDDMRFAICQAERGRDLVLDDIRGRVGVRSWGEKTTCCPPPVPTR